MASKRSNSETAEHKLKSKAIAYKLQASASYANTGGLSGASLSSVSNSDAMSVDETVTAVPTVHTPSAKRHLNFGSKSIFKLFRTSPKLSKKHLHDADSPEDYPSSLQIPPPSKFDLTSSSSQPFYHFNNPSASFQLPKRSQRTAGSDSYVTDDDLNAAGSRVTKQSSLGKSGSSKGGHHVVKQGKSSSLAGSIDSAESLQHRVAGNNVGLEDSYSHKAHHHNITSPKSPSLAHNHSLQYPGTTTVEGAIPYNSTVVGDHYKGVSGRPSPTTGTALYSTQQSQPVQSQQQQHKTSGATVGSKDGSVKEKKSSTLGSGHTGGASSTSSQGSRQNHPIIFPQREQQQPATLHHHNSASVFRTVASANTADGGNMQSSLANVSMSQSVTASNNSSGNRWDPEVTDIGLTQSTIDTLQQSIAEFRMKLKDAQAKNEAAVARFLVSMQNSSHIQEDAHRKDFTRENKQSQSTVHHLQDNLYKLQQLLDIVHKEGIPKNHDAKAYLKQIKQRIKEKSGAGGSHDGSKKPILVTVKDAVGNMKETAGNIGRSLGLHSPLPRSNSADNLLTSREKSPNPDSITEHHNQLEASNNKHGVYTTTTLPRGVAANAYMPTTNSAQHSKSVHNLDPKNVNTSSTTTASSIKGDPGGGAGGGSNKKGVRSHAALSNCSPSSSCTNEHPGITVDDPMAALVVTPLFHMGGNESDMSGGWAGGYEYGGQMQGLKEDVSMIRDVVETLKSKFSDLHYNLELHQNDFEGFKQDYTNRSHEVNARGDNLEALLTEYKTVTQREIRTLKESNKDINDIFEYRMKSTMGDIKDSIYGINVKVANLESRLEQFARLGVGPAGLETGELHTPSILMLRFINLVIAFAGFLILVLSAGCQFLVTIYGIIFQLIHNRRVQLTTLGVLSVCFVVYFFRDTWTDMIVKLCESLLRLVKKNEL